MANLGRLLTAMVTPFDEQGAVNYEQAKKLALALLDSGSDGVVVSGTTGESPTLSKEEKLRLFGEVKSAVGSRGTVIAGTGSYSTRESIELSVEARRLGVDGVLLVVPYYNKPTQEGLYQHFRSIAEGAQIPCILYNVPSRTITNLIPETVLHLAQVEYVLGIKEASGNLEQVAKVIHGAPQGFLVWSGNDADTFPIMAMGGYGAVSVVSHLVGFQVKEMMEKLPVDLKGAAAIHHHLLPLVNALFILSNPIPIKYMLDLVGFPVGKPRLPLTEPDEKSAEAIRKTLEKYRKDLPVR